MHLAAIVCNAGQHTAVRDTAAVACMRLQSLAAAAVEVS